MFTEKKKSGVLGKYVIVEKGMQNQKYKLNIGFIGAENAGDFNKLLAQLASKHLNLND